jgi:hypothetical protein
MKTSVKSAVTAFISWKIYFLKQFYYLYFAPKITATSNKVVTRISFNSFKTAK